MKMNNSFIDKALKSYYTTLPDLDYFIIANTLYPSKQNCNLANANKDEMFSKTEFSEIASAIFDAFGFVNVFYSEQEFIKFILNDSTVKPINSFVFNFARNGRKEGKKSLIPAFCDLYNIKYSGSDALILSLIRNKFYWGKFLLHYGVPTPEFCLFENTGKIIGDQNSLYGKTVIAKNISEAASIDLNDENVFLLNKNSTKHLNELIKRMQANRIIVQEFIPGKECEVLVYQDKRRYYACDPIEIICSNSCYMNSDISNNYLYKFGNLSDSCDSEIISRIKFYAEKAAYLLNIKDYARFDFRINGRDIYLFDIAGTPYSIKHSSIAFLFTHVYNYKYSDIYKCLASISYNNYISAK